MVSTRTHAGFGVGSGLWDLVCGIWSVGSGRWDLVGPQVAHMSTIVA